MSMLLNTDLGTKVLSYLTLPNQKIVVHELCLGLDDGQLEEHVYILTSRPRFSEVTLKVLGYNPFHLKYPKN